ncbi:MAG: hypothetical protein PHE19_00785 [Candidatus Cloacimonetes bacterium]|nr:hypothetical protein [Candidatus Cloacimonadota bacterium]
MKNIFLSLFLCVMALSIISCDSRNTERPDISVSIDKEKIYYPHLGDNSYYEAKAIVSLTGKDDQTKNALIELTFDDSIIAILTNTGNEKLLRTDDRAVAEATIISRHEGIANINFKVKNWSSNVNGSILVSLPEISSFTTNKDTIIADNIDEATLVAKVIPPMNNKYIKFVSSLGIVEHDSVATDINGVAINKFKSSTSGKALITAKLKDWQSQINTLNISVLDEEE